MPLMLRFAPSWISVTAVDVEEEPINLDAELRGAMTCDAFQSLGRTKSVFASSGMSDVFEW